MRVDDFGVRDLNSRKVDGATNRNVVKRDEHKRGCRINCGDSVLPINTFYMCPTTGAQMKSNHYSLVIFIVVIRSIALEIWVQSDMKTPAAGQKRLNL